MVYKNPGKVFKAVATIQFIFCGLYFEVTLNDPLFWWTLTR